MKINTSTKSLNHASRDENERGRTGNYLSHFCYHFLPKMGAGMKKAVMKTVTKYMSIRKRTNIHRKRTVTGH
jgi:hypothetical protein